MVGIVVSDMFLLVGEWDSHASPLALENASKIDYAEPISHFVFKQKKNIKLSLILIICLSTFGNNYLEIFMKWYIG